MGSDIVDLDQFRRKRGRPSDMLVGCCLYCGEEFQWTLRHDHRCAEISKRNHPASS